MKRVLSLVFLLTIIFSICACFSKDKSSESSVEKESEAEADNSEMTETEDKKKESISESESEETASNHSGNENIEDFQADIPEEYRLKVNIPSDMNEPLPSSEYADNSPLFGIGDVLEGQQQGNQEPRKSINLPKVIDLFTIEELENYFGMVVYVNEEGNLIPFENEDSVTYLLYETETETPKSLFCDGKVYISLKDWGNPATAASYINFFRIDPREIEISGKRALIQDSDNDVSIYVTDSVILDLIVEFKGQDGWLVPADQELVLKFAQLVCERLMEKME
ncbi:MAG: hypothetical protein GX328_01865 [Clostridiaceae bacterium]|nr:hypothetical protein [Clostridiaceae bacterium]